MKFTERLAKAIKDQDIETVKAMLQVLQMKYDNQKWRPTISLLTRGSDDEKLIFHKGSKPLGELALESNFEIFKLLVGFFIKNYTHLDDSIAHDSINHFYYQAIFKHNLTVVKFFVEDIGVDLLNDYSEPSKDWNIKFKTWHSPLEAAASSPEIFQFLFPHCIIAYERIVNKHLNTDLLNPLITYLNSKIAEIKKDGQGIPGNVELLKTLEHHLRFTECFKDIYEIFYSEKIFIIFIFRNLGQAFPKNPELCIEILGDLLGKNARKTSLNIINTFIKVLLNMIRERSAEEQIPLKKLFVTLIMPHAAQMANKLSEEKNKHDESIKKDLQVYQFLLKHEGLIHENVSQQPAESKLEESKSEPKEEIITDTTQLSDIVKYEMAHMLFSDGDQKHEALLIWSELASKGYEKAFHLLKSIAENKSDPILDTKLNRKIENHTRFLLGNLYYQGIPSIKVAKDITAAIEFWTDKLTECFMNDDEHEMAINRYFFEMQPKLIDIADDSQIDLPVRILATNKLLRFYFADFNHLELLKWINYYINTLQQTLPPQFTGFKYAEELNLLIKMYNYLINYQPQENSVESLTTLEIQYYSSVSTRFIVAVAKAAFEGKHGFKQDSNKAAHICLKFFRMPKLSFFENNVLSLLHEIIIKNDSSTHWLPPILTQAIFDPNSKHFIFNKNFSDLLETTIKTLGAASRHNYLECLEKLFILYQQYVSMDNAIAKNTLYEQFLTLLESSETSAHISSQMLEAILSKIIILHHDRQVKGSPKYLALSLQLKNLKSFILTIFTLNQNLNEWLTEARTVRKIDTEKISFQFFKFIPTPENNLALLLDLSIASMNELSNCITTFFNKGEAKLNLQIFLQNPKETEMDIQQISDIYTAIETFSTTKLQISLPDKNHPLSKLKNELFKVTEKPNTDKPLAEETKELKGPPL